MKTIFIWLGAILLIAAVVAGAIYFLRPKESTPPPPTSFPTSPTQTGTQSTVSVVGGEGDTVTTKDFIHNGTTIEDASNPGNYVLAGSMGCASDTDCPSAGSFTDFVIVYYSYDNSFVVGLKKEPLGSVRLQAEQYLMDTLGLSKEEMCKLNYDVGTTVYVNQTYGGQNLGFSFCPGATKLP